MAQLGCPLKSEQILQEHYADAEHHQRRNAADHISQTAIRMATHHLFIVADEEDQEHQGRGHQAIDGCGLIQSSHRIDPDKIDSQSDERGDGDDAVETMRLLQFLTQTRLPTKKFGNGVG